jgi:hypothetical protein
VTILCALTDLSHFSNHSPETPHEQILKRGHWSLGVSLQYRRFGRGEHHGRGRPNPAAFSSVRRGRIRSPDIPMSSTPGSPGGNRQLTLSGPAPAEVTANGNWLRRTVHRAVHGMHRWPAVPAKSPSPQLGQAQKYRSAAPARSWGLAQLTGWPARRGGEEWGRIRLLGVMGFRAIEGMFTRAAPMAAAGYWLGRQNASGQPGVPAPGPG